MQRLSTPDGYLFPLDIIQGLAYLKIRPPNDHEMDTLPHVIITSDMDWDPTLFDNKIDSESDHWFDPQDVPEWNSHQHFDDLGNFNKRQLMVLNIFADDSTQSFFTFDVSQKPTIPDYIALQPYFGRSSIDIIKHTIDNTTQYVHSLQLYQDMRKHYKSRFPALNCSRRNEDVATDTIFSDTPAIDNGSKCAQFFVGRELLVADIYPMKDPKQFVCTLEDNIRRRGAMKRLISDRAQSEISNKAIYYVHFSLMSGRANPTTNTRIMLNVDMVPSNHVPI